MVKRPVFVTREADGSAEMRLGRQVAEALIGAGRPVKTLGWAVDGGRVWPGWAARWRRGGDVVVELGMNPASRADAVVAARPDPELAEKLLRERPDVRLAVVDAGVRDDVAQRVSGADRRIDVLPYPVPDVFYAPGDATHVHDISRLLRLERRPRLLYTGGYGQGRTLTRLMGAARALLTHDGEMILANGIEARASLAPVVKHMGLSERVIFTPVLSDAQLAGLLHGADLLVYPDESAAFPYTLTYATAAGLPVVGVDTPPVRAATGRAALLVDPLRDEVWPDAVREGLHNAGFRERMIERGMALAVERRAATAVGRWIAWLDEMGSR